jgi:hypothetical protein
VKVTPPAIARCSPRSLLSSQLMAVDLFLTTSVPARKV